MIVLRRWYIEENNIQFVSVALVSNNTEMNKLGNSFFKGNIFSRVIIKLNLNSKIVYTLVSNLASDDNFFQY